MAESNTLTLDRIAELLSTTKRRGEYELACSNHVATGDLAVIVSDLPYFKGKDANAVRNSFNLNIEKKSKENEWPALTVVVDKSDKDNVQVILVNMDVLATQTAEATVED